MSDATDSPVAGDHQRLMDRVYARQRHIYDLSRKYYLLGRDSLIAELDPPPRARVLEIGCGTGRNLIRIARTYPRVGCYGVDISRQMLVTADAAIARAGLAPRIALAEGDAANFDPIALFDVPAFDRIVISYALSMIPPWREVLRHASGLLAPDGALHLVDFGDQTGLPPAFRRLLGAWLARFHVAPRAGLADEVAAVARERGLAATTRGLYRGYAISARMAQVPARAR